jgi:hypothetical protein
MLPGFQVCEPVQGGQTGTPTSRSIRLAQGEFGMDYGARAYGHRGSVVVAGVTPCQRGRESRLHGQGTRVLRSAKDGEVPGAPTPPPLAAQATAPSSSHRLVSRSSRHLSRQARRLSVIGPETPLRGLCRTFGGSRLC